MKSKLMILLFVIAMGLAIDIWVVGNHEEVSAHEIKKERIPDLPDWKPVDVCNADNSIKNYMDYRAITDMNSKQYQIVSNAENFNGLLYYNGAICVALGSVYGEVGTVYKITLESGRVLLVIKADEKSDAHTVNRCNNANGSILELIVDSESMDELVKETGNYNDSEILNGRIIKMETGGY